MLQLGTSICRLELPVHTLLTVVSLGMPRRKFLVKFFDTVYAPFCQTLVPESREFNLSYVKPAAVLGRVVYFKALCFIFGWRKLGEGVVLLRFLWWCMARTKRAEILYIFFGIHTANVAKLADRIEQRASLSAA